MVKIVNDIIKYNDSSIYCYKNGYGIKIATNPKTKKNSQRILKNHRTGKIFIGQSEQYEEYENFCKSLIKCMLPKEFKPINYPVNIMATYYRSTRHKVDISNLNSALHDILVASGILIDDNCKIIAATDGSRVMYGKENPRTEIIITKMEGWTPWE